jgi:hypothetical protein
MVSFTTDLCLVAADAPNLADQVSSRTPCTYPGRAPGIRRDTPLLMRISFSCVLDNEASGDELDTMFLATTDNHDDGRLTFILTKMPDAFSLTSPFVCPVVRWVDREVGLEAGKIRIDRCDLSPGIIDSRIS